MAALLGEMSSDKSELATLHLLPVEAIDPNPHQPRGPIDAQSVEELGRSLATQGVLQPLLVRRAATPSSRFIIVAGERRWRAAMAVGLATVPCLIQNMNEQQAAAAALVENLQRLDLNSMEEAQGFQRLQSEFGLTQEALSEIVGKSRSHVANTLRLLKLPPDVQDQVRAGVLTAGHARAVLSHPDPSQAAKHIVARDLSVRRAESWVLQAAEPDQGKKAVRDVETTAIESDLSEQLGVAVSLRVKDGRGRLSLSFSTLDQLDVLLARLGRVG